MVVLCKLELLPVHTAQTTPSSAVLFQLLPVPPCVPNGDRSLPLPGLFRRVYEQHETTAVPIGVTNQLNHGSYHGLVVSDSVWYNNPRGFEPR